MNDIKSLSHSKWRCQYHIVFAPKYRRKERFGFRSKYNPELMSLEGLNAKNGFAFVTSDTTIVAVTVDGKGVSGDGIIGYTVFMAKTNLSEDAASFVTFPADQLTDYGENLKVTYPTAPSVKVNIFGAPPISGDVNLDGVVNLADAILLMQYLSGNTELSSKQLRAADVSKDGIVNVGDTILIMQLCLD